MNVILFIIRSSPTEQLWQASYCGYAGEVLELLQKDVPPDSDYYLNKHRGESPLYRSCYNGHSLTAEYLLKWGAKVDAITEYGWIPLHTASALNHLDCVRLLLENYSPTGELMFYNEAVFVVLY